MSSGIKFLQFQGRRKLSMVHQQEQMDCGYACVAMLCDYWGHRLDLHSMKELVNARTYGVTLLDLIHLLDALGFTSRALTLPLNTLSQVACPAILHWNMNHFVVLARVKKRGIWIHDPAVGVQYCKMEEVSKAFTGVVLEVERKPDFKALRHRRKLSLFSLLKSVRGVNKFISLLFIFSLAIELFTMMSPLFLQYVTDEVLSHGEKTNLYILAAVFLLLYLLQIMTDYCRGNMIIYFTSHLTEQFSSNVLQHLLKLPLSFFEKRHKGDLQAKFQSIDHIQKKISSDFVTTLLDGLMILTHFTVMYIYSPLLCGFVGLSLSLYGAVRYFSYQTLKKETEISIQQHAKAMTVFLQSLQGIVAIKSFLKENLRFNAWRNRYIDSLNADIQVAKMRVLFQGINQCLFQVEYMALVCVGASFVLSQRFSLGMLMAFLAFRHLLVNKAISFIDHVIDYQLISIQLNRLNDILFQTPEKLGKLSQAPQELKGRLRLDKLAFRYNGHDAELFKQLSLDVVPGEKLAIIGPSGCGKTSLLKVMMGLLQPTAGEIYIDEIPLRTFGLGHYRQAVASVMQEDVLLPGSILDNIAFFDEKMDIDRVYHVAELACVHAQILKLPMAYETLVGDMGSCLSGGQKQRILLARALYKQPKILFLDEATSHLDLVNEMNINKNLKALNITQIIIAHRQETIQMADRIVDLS
jgi:ATP-binding cassette subfamily B protein RaxB